MKKGLIGTGVILTGIFTAAQISFVAAQIDNYKGQDKEGVIIGANAPYIIGTGILTAFLAKKYKEL